MGINEASHEMEWTGERLVPSVQGDVAIEHLHRYALAESLAEGRVVLDVACGEGYGSYLMARRAARVIGVDIAAEAIAHALRKYQSSNLSFRVGDATNLPVDSGSIDLVISFETLEHLEQHEAMLDEIKRVLKPDGLLLISTPDRDIYTVKHGQHNPYHLREQDAYGFFALLTGRFRHVSLFRQRLVRGSLILADRIEEAPVFRTLKGNYAEISHHIGLPDATYLIGMAGNVPVPADLTGYFEGLDIHLDLEVELGNARAGIERFRETVAHLEQELEAALVRDSRLTGTIEEYQCQLSSLLAERERVMRGWAEIRAELEQSESARDGALADKVALEQALATHIEEATILRAQLEQALATHIEEATILRAQLEQALATAVAERRHFETAYHDLIGSRFWRYSRVVRETTRRVRWVHGLAAQAPRALVRRLPPPIRVPLVRLRDRLRGAAKSTRCRYHHIRDEIRFVGDVRRHGPVFAKRDVTTVSIIIPVHNHYRETVACLCSIQEHTGPIDYEIIVVDDASTDLTRWTVGRIRNLVYLRNWKNLGFISACNAGAAQAQGEYLVFLNNDTVVTPGWLEELLRTFEVVPEAGLVGTKLVYPDGRLQEAGGIIWRDASGWNFGRYGDPDDPEYNYARDVDYCSGACIMVRRELFRELGGFDVRYAPAYYEDTDLAFQVRRRGLRVIYQPLSCLVHHEGLSSGTDTSTGIKAYQVRNQVTFREKWAEVLAGHPAPSGDPCDRFPPGGRVLVIDHMIPTPDQDSGSLRMFCILGILKQRGLDVTFLPDNMAPAGLYLHDLQRIGVRTVYHPYIDSIREYLQGHGHRYSLVWICRPDIAHRHLDDVRRHAPGAQVVFDTVDLHFVRQMREADLLGDLELARLAELQREQELGVAAASDYTIVVSRDEAEVLARHADGLDIRVITNIHEAQADIPGFAGRSGIIFIGGFNHLPNVDAMRYFVGEIFPELRRRIPGVTLTILGSHPPESVRQLACADIAVTGFVPDVSGYFRRCRVSVAPLRYGAGVKGKVNMSLAYGVPAVVSPVAAEGMNLVDGWDVLIAADPASFAEAVARVYQSEPLWERLSRNGLHNIEEYFSTRVAAAEIDRLLRDAGLGGDAPALQVVGHVGAGPRVARMAS